MSDNARLSGEEHQIDCPECDWQSHSFEEISGEIAAKVDAEMHYIETHDPRIPDDAPFGYNQCPKCLDTDGFSDTVSCSKCGFVPGKVRA